MLRAVIFDFNGIILDDEPLHFKSMQEVAASLGAPFTQEEYYNRYLPFDDEACLTAICTDYSLQLTELQRREALQRKSELYHRLLEGRYPLFPGAAPFIRSASRRFPLAIASGARREDIRRTLLAAELADCFRVVVGAEDFTRGKPHPESFLMALERLNGELDGEARPVEPEECLVIEDSVGGVRGARAAGMTCLAVSNTYPRERLLEADLIVSSLGDVELGQLERLFGDRQ